MRGKHVDISCELGRTADVTFIPCDYVLFRAQESEGMTKAGSQRSDRAEYRPSIFPYLSHHLPYSALTHLGNLWLRMDASDLAKRFQRLHTKLGGSSSVKSVYLEFQQKLAHRVAAILTRSITS